VALSQYAIALVFEAGDRGMANSRNDGKEKGCIPPTFRPKKDALRKDGTIEPDLCPASCGWLAWKSNRAIQTFYEGNWSPKKRCAGPCRNFSGFRVHGRLTPENIQDMEGNIDVMKRITDWQVETGLIKAARGML